MASVQRRERRVLMAGVASVLALLAVDRGSARWREARANALARYAEACAAVDGAREVLSSEAALRDTMVARAAAAAGLSDSVIHARGTGAALAELASEIGAVAEETGLVLEQVVTLPLADSTVALRRIAIRAQYAGTLQTVADFLERVEAMTILTRVVSVTVQSLDVSATQGSDAPLRGEVVLEALALVDSVKA